MPLIEVYADVACPFTHAGLRRYVAARRERGLTEPTLRIRAWPLELVNGKPLEGPTLAPKIAALRAGVSPDLFRGFDPDRFPRTSLPALAAESAAYRVAPAVGEAFGLAVRDALFEQGLDISDPEVLRRLSAAHGVPDATETDEEQVRADHEEGRRRGVTGSPHFFTPDGESFFCPSLDIEHEGDRYEVSFDDEGFARFMGAAFA